MKSTQLPPVRVTPAVRAQIERVLQEGETLSQFVEQATVQAAQRRSAQRAFVARGRAALARAQAKGEYYDVTEALSAMQARVEARIAPHRPGKPPEAAARA